MREPNVWDWDMTGHSAFCFQSVILYESRVSVVQRDDFDTAEWSSDWSHSHTGVDQPTHSICNRWSDSDEMNRVIFKFYDVITVCITFACAINSVCYIRLNMLRRFYNLFDSELYCCNMHLLEMSLACISFKELFCLSFTERFRFTHDQGHIKASVGLGAVVTMFPSLIHACTYNL